MSLCQLLEELPDPDQELVTQVDHNLDLKSFTIFNELPVELRLAIVSTFPLISSTTGLYTDHI